MTRLWLDLGLRRSELAELMVEDVDQVAQTVSVMGKGSKPRTVVYGSRASLALDRYLRVRRRRPYA